LSSVFLLRISSVSLRRISHGLCLPLNRSLSPYFGSGGSRGPDPPLLKLAEQTVVRKERFKVLFCYKTTKYDPKMNYFALNFQKSLASGAPPPDPRPPAPIASEPPAKISGSAPVWVTLNLLNYSACLLSDHLALPPDPPQ